MTFLKEHGSVSGIQFLGVNMATIQTTAPKKAKTTVYMTQEEETLLNELFIKRLRERRKTDKSALLCEALRLLFAQEIGALNHE